jgi:ppGpp synthetase/RelA/SpoT-type nucleotidyltranferase
MEFRIKDFESMKDKIIKRYNKLPKDMSPEKQLLKAFGKVNDSMGIRINFNPKDLSEASIMRLLKIFKNNSSFPITQIDNYHGLHTRPYISHSKLQGLKIQGKIKTASKESGYKALQINLGDEIEIQIKSARLTAFGDWEHDVKYKSKGHSGTAYKNLSEEEEKVYHSYLVKCYDYISKLDNAIKKAKEPEFPDGLDEILKYKNFNTGKKSAEILNKPRLGNITI